MRSYLLALSMVLGACAPDTSLNSGTAGATDSEASASGADSSGGPDPSSTSLPPGEVSSGSSTGDGPLAPPVTFASGSRLQAVVNQSPSGEQTLHHWYDTELSLDCAVLYDTAGDLRCLPVTAASLLFADDLCTTPAIHNAGCHRADDLVVTSETSCQHHGLYSAVRVQEPLQIVYRDTAGQGCELQAWSPTNANRAEPLEPGMFALATPRVESEGSDLARVVLEFEDGAWTWAGPYDSDRDTDCGPWTLDGRTVCVPAFRTLVAHNAYADDACSGNPLGSEFVRGECGHATVALESAPYDIVSEPSDGVWHVGPAVEDPFIDRENEGCSPLVPDPESSLEFEYWSLTAATADDFPNAEPIQIGEGRFRPEYLLDSAAIIVATNGALLGAQTWYDDELGFSCQVGELITGDFGCVPQPQVLTSWYADEACTVPLMNDDPLLIAGGPIRASDWVSLVTTMNCGNDFPVVAYGTIGEPHDGPVFQKFFGEDCEPGTLPNPRAVSNLHLAGEIETFDRMVIP